jgi:hypothetical protein
VVAVGWATAVIIIMVDIFLIKAIKVVQELSYLM